VSLRALAGNMATCVVLLCMIVCVAQLVHGHSTHYNLEPEVIRMYEKNGSLPPFRSYHIHVMFIFGNEESVNTAMALRARFVEHFNLTNTANCTGLFDQGRLCMFGNSYDCTCVVLPTEFVTSYHAFAFTEVHTEPEVHTPFVSGQWAVFLRTEDFPVCMSR
jgi:hypothetical protein